MSAVAIKGWCPGALRPMQSGDGLVVRVRPFGGRLEAAQVAGIADLAERYGNGLIDRDEPRQPPDQRRQRARPSALLIEGLASWAARPRYRHRSPAQHFGDAVLGQR